MWKSRVPGRPHRRSIARGRPMSGPDDLRRGRDDVVDRATEQLEARRIELVRPRPDPLRRATAAAPARRQRLARHEDHVGGLVDEASRPVRRSAPARSRCRSPRRAGASRACCRRRARSRRRAHARTGRQPGDLVDELEVARAHEHRDDRDTAGGQDLALVGVERRRRDEVVVEPVEPLGHVVDERALRLDQPGKVSTSRSAS